MKKIIVAALLFVSLFTVKAQATEPFLGQIMYVPYNFVPRNWAECNGQLLPINQNTALFSLLGTTYGGNGINSFALPDMRGRVLLGSGQGPGLSNYTNGQTGGKEAHTLTVNEMPGHNHTVNAVSAEGNQHLPTNALPANTKALDKEYSNFPPTVQMSPLMINPTGGSQAHENRQPYVVLKCIIALTGVYPSQY